MRDLTATGAILVRPGDRLRLRHALDGVGEVDETALPVRAGDVVRMSCPPAIADLLHVDPHFVILRWPWPRTRLDGSPLTREVYVLRDLTCRIPGLWHYDPDPADPGALRIGDQITVNASGDVWVRYTPTGYSRDLGVLPQGVPLSQAGEPGSYQDRRIIIDPFEGEPWTVQLLHRPYPWLEDGDVVLDANARRWMFCLPPAWVCLENGASATSLTRRPQIPLQLLYGRHDDPPNVEHVTLVAQASNDFHGCLQELFDWGDAAGADPVPAGRNLRAEDEPPLDEDETHDEEARTRADLHGRAREEIAMDLKDAFDREDTADHATRADRIGEIYAARVLVRRQTIEHILEQMYLFGIEHYTGQEL